MIRSFVRNLIQIPKLSLFFFRIDSFWLLFFWRIKNALYRRGKCIYIYIYIYICIYWVLLGGFDAINVSNQRTICSYMIFQPSWFILYLIFSINSIVFYEIFYNDVIASRDATYLFTNPYEICTAYVKLISKHILLVRIFRFIFRDNYDISIYILIKLWSPWLYVCLFVWDRAYESWIRNGYSNL